MADQSTPPKRKVPLGKALKFTPKQLDELSTVTPADILKAQQFWKEHAPKRYKNLLDAESVDNQEQPTP